MKLRTYRPEDCAAVMRLFYGTVHTVNAKDYTPAQLDAWAPPDADMARWQASFAGHFALVAEERGEIAGFGDMDGGGYLDRLYVHCRHQGEGVGTMLADALEAHAAACGCRAVTTHASLTARPFFEGRGYTTVRPNAVRRGGQVLVNYLMKKSCLHKTTESKYEGHQCSAEPGLYRQGHRLFPK